MSAPYAGKVTDEEVAEVIKTYGELLDGAAEAGFIMVYRFAGDTHEEGLSGRLVLAGEGISHDHLREVVERALEADRCHGFTR